MLNPDSGDRVIIKNVPVRQFIIDTLYSLYKTCDTDRYGQIRIFNLQPHIFKDREEEVRQYAKETGCLTFSNYAGKVGVYEAFRINDGEMLSACNRGLNQNENYRRNINNW